MGYRDIELAPEVEATYDEFVEAVEKAFRGDAHARRLGCRELLASIYFPGPKGYSQLMQDSSLPVASKVVVSQLDPANATLEHERYTDIDPERYAEIKPVVWFWVMFDRSPLGRNVHLGLRVRQVLAEKVFKSCGKDLKIFHDVEFTWGYNLEVGDESTLHRGVFLDDRGGLKIGKRVSISDWANVYTHTHSVEDIHDVSCYPTSLGDDVRLTYHSTLLAGNSIGENGLLAACGLGTKDIPAGWVWGGVPAKPIMQKKLDPDSAAHDGCC